MRMLMLDASDGAAVMQLLRRERCGPSDPFYCYVLNIIAVGMEVKARDSRSSMTESAIAQPQAHDEQPPPRIRGVGLLGAPSADGDQLVEVEVRATCARLMRWWTSRRPPRPHAWRRQPARASTAAWMVAPVAMAITVGRTMSRP